jgi:hypothetical protein
MKFFQKVGGEVCGINIPHLQQFPHISFMYLQQKMFMYIKWFQWILSEFIDRSEQDLARIEWIHWSTEWGLMNCTHII